MLGGKGCSGVISQKQKNLEEEEEEEAEGA
jgi:hypothetical protein